MLNLWLLLPILSSIVNGLNSSLMNGVCMEELVRRWFDIRSSGLQIIPAWQEFFDHPEGKVLGTHISCLSL